MLVPADIVAGKLLVQLGWVPPQRVRKQLRVTSDEPDTSLDLVSRLAWNSQLDRQQYAAIRRYVALFEHVRHEAIYLRLLEQQGLGADEACELIAQVELHAYRRRIGELLVERGRLTPQQHEQLDRRAREKLLREDLRVLRRYEDEDFRGVARPLLPTRHVDTSVFRLPVLFRTPHTLRAVDLARERLAAAVALDDDLEDDPDAGWATSVLSDEESKHIARARFEGKSGTVEVSGSVGPYEVSERLGRGAAGSVYLARRRGTGPLVALKVLRPEFASPEDTERFSREARICRRLDQASAVRLIDEGIAADGTHYMALSAIAGASLRQELLDAGGQGLPLQVAFGYLRQLVEALESIHRAGVIHRDLKPANVMVQAGRGRLLIVDFGIARLQSELQGEDDFRTATGAISGSPAYVAPETVAGEPFDARVDLYALGVVLFEMLSGRLPLEAPSPYAFLKEHLVGVPRTLAEVRPQIPWPAELEQLVARLLAKEPGQRPTSARELRKLLEGGFVERCLSAIERGERGERGDQGLIGNPFFPSSS